MATPEAERQARAGGDVPRARLAPLAGALVAAGVALEVTAEGAAARLVALTRATLAAEGEPAATAAAWLRAGAAALAPVLGAAFLGALAVGVLQTRGYLGRPRAAEPPERPTPPALLSVLGWIALALTALDLLRAATGLGGPADTVVLGRATLGLARDLARTLFVGVAALAFVDHLLRARARRVRLDTVERAPRPGAAAGGEPIVDLLTGAERLVVYDELVLVLGRRQGALVALARVRGLQGHAVVDAARRRGLPVRAARSAAALEALLLGVPLGAGELAALDLAAPIEASA